MEEQQEWLRVSGAEVLENFLVQQLVGEVLVPQLEDEGIRESAAATLKRVTYKQVWSCQWGSYFSVFVSLKFFERILMNSMDIAWDGLQITLFCCITVSHR